MSSDVVIRFTQVSKRYSRQSGFDNSLREQLMGLFSAPRSRAGLRDGEFWALQEIDLSIIRGECVGLCGANGSGKSTLLKLISNITFPTLGQLEIGTRIAPLIELGAGFHPDLNGIENIYMNGTILGLSVGDVKRKLDEIVGFAELRDFIQTPVKKYSSGMALRLAFSIAIHSPAETFLFDEVLAVGDTSFRAKCADKINQLKQMGKTIVIVSHDLEGMKQYCTRMVQLNQGRVVSDTSVLANGRAEIL